MAAYEIIERWIFEESDDSEDESRKEVQIVRHTGNDGISTHRRVYLGF